MTNAHKKIGIQLIGFGTVGVGIAKILKTEPRYKNVSLVSVTDTSGTAYDPLGLDLARLIKIKSRTNRIVSYPPPRCSYDWTAGEAIEKGEADIVIEATPSNITDGQPALKFIRSALCSGKDVISANKGPFALHYKELVDLAESRNRNLRFSATVCGVLPHLENITDLNTAGPITSIKGILNSSTNYILSRMHEEELVRTRIEKEAQGLGILEADPILDTGGYDAAAKVSILANHIFGKDITLRDVAIKGIQNIELEEVKAAKRTGRIIKPICRISDNDAKVGVETVPIVSPYAKTGISNVVRIKTESAREYTFISKAAGEYDTASAVIGDLNRIIG